MRKFFIVGVGMLVVGVGSLLPFPRAVNSQTPPGPAPMQYWNSSGGVLNPSNQGLSTAATLLTNNIGKAWLILAMSPTNAADTRVGTLSKTNGGGFGPLSFAIGRTNLMQAPSSLGDVWVINEGSSSGALGQVQYQFAY